MNADPSSSAPTTTRTLVTDGLAVRHLDHLLTATVQRHPDRVATRIRTNPDGDAVWRTQTYRQFDIRIQGIARALIRAGVAKGDRVALFANNCPEWSEIDFGLLRVGAVPVPIYATSTPEQIAHIVTDSGSRGIFVGGLSEAGRVRESRQHLPELEWLVSIPESPDDDVPALDEWIVGEGASDQVADLDAEISRRQAAASGDDLASIIYTSGTTGDPKGVMLHHSALVAQVDAVATLFPITAEDHSLSFLPLSHALERAWTTIVFAHGCMNTYLPNARLVGAALVEVQPSMMVSVPKLYETVYRVAHEKAASSPVKKRIFDWAFRAGGRAQHAYRKGRQPSSWTTTQVKLADTLVFKNIREAIGGTKTVLACGGAPIRKEVEEFFSAAGIQIFTGYGLTEASPLVSFNSRAAWKIGTAGRVMLGGEIAIGANSEILYRGPNLMAGYWNNDEATAETITADGWLHTGDAGYVDTDGFLVITDRIQDIIVTLGGKNVAPQQIEGLVLSDPLFEHAVLIGEGRPFLTLLVRPSLPQLKELAERVGITTEKDDDLVDHPQVLAELRARVSALTAKLPSHEQIKDLRASIEEFTMDNGLLTPTLKVRRREVEKKFQSVIDEMYAKLHAARRAVQKDQNDD